MGDFVEFEEIGLAGTLYINPVHVSAVKEIFRMGQPQEDGKFREDCSGSRLYIGETYYFEVTEPPSTVIRKLRASIGQFV